MVTVYKQPVVLAVGDNRLSTMSIKRSLNKSVGSVATYFARLRRARQCRLYCVGMAKSGTHSIASMFDGHLRSQHERENKALIRTILDLSSGRISGAELRAWVKQRDRQLYLDIDSSQLNYFLLVTLVKEFADAHFLLTIRDCYSWLDSFINHSLRHKASEEFLALRALRFKPDIFMHPPEEQLLAEKGLYTLDGYLSYWAEHNQKVIATVPADRLMIVRTDKITQSAHNIAGFVGLPAESVRVENSHAFKTPKKYGILHEIDRDHLERKIQQYCAPLMQQFFPEIKSMADAPVGYRL